MVSRRALLIGTTGVAAVAAVSGAAATHRLDDALRAVGVDPKPEPDPGDLRLTRQARAHVVALVALAAGAPEAVVAALEQQRDALPTGAPATAQTPATAQFSGALVAACRAAADARATDALAAVSSDLVLVLASMSAGLDQCATYLADR